MSGGSARCHANVRIIGATHRDLRDMVARGTFREDLWRRISVFPIQLPPLRERREDIPRLAAHFRRARGDAPGRCPSCRPWKISTCCWHTTGREMFGNWPPSSSARRFLAPAERCGSPRRWELPLRP